MRYIKPEYTNENVNVEDVITSSYFITPDEKNEQGEPTKITITGYLSHLLGKQ